MYIPSYNTPDGFLKLVEPRTRKRSDREEFEARLREMDRRLGLAEKFLEPQKKKAA